MLDRSSAPDIFERYGLKRIINASGTETTKGASPVCQEVIDAVVALVPNSVDMLELQSLACHTIGKAFGCEAGIVVNCSAAGISTAVAACMTGSNLARVERLPDTAGLKTEVILQRGHNITYGGYVTQNVAITGGRIVEIGAATECGAYQLADALNENTAAALYVVSHHTVQSGLIDLETFCKVAHERGVPVIVDGAAEPEPRAFLRAGADLVITSMHKSFAGLTAATVAGRLDLIRACLYQEKGIGRPMKVGKEGIIASIAAVERWAKLDRAAVAQALHARLGRGVERLGKLPGLKVEIELDSTSKLFSRLLLTVDETKAGLSAFDLSKRLADQKPSIAVRTLMADIGLLQVDLRRADEATADHIIGCVERIVQAAKTMPAESRVRDAKATENLADLALASLQRFPLSLGSAR
ncbi:aminotransferase class V-fold PLP-dependent enzyme [Mesorhizobium sp. ASY16-5R]|uniref:aminotransferase class V-fold PLP-dependent enzyme n=1 Tax=Mesorhizobium sp. ASY16-5R TaxID=3445772 RepID=UPI003F9FD642